MPSITDSIALTAEERKLSDAMLWGDEVEAGLNTPYPERVKNFMAKLQAQRDERWTPEIRAMTVSGPAMLTQTAKKLRPGVLYEGDLVVTARCVTTISAAGPTLKKTIVYGTVTSSFSGENWENGRLVQYCHWIVWWTDTNKCETVTTKMLEDDWVRLVS